MKSPIEALMEEAGIPMTRANYLHFTNLGKNTQPSAEEESELPTRFAYVAPLLVVTTGEYGEEGNVLLFKWYLFLE